MKSIGYARTDGFLPTTCTNQDDDDSSDGESVSTDSSSSDSVDEQFLRRPARPASPAKQGAPGQPHATRQPQLADLPGLAGADPRARIPSGDKLSGSRGLEPISSRQGSRVGSHTEGELPSFHALREKEKRRQQDKAGTPAPQQHRVAGGGAASRTSMSKEPQRHPQHPPPGSGPLLPNQVGGGSGGYGGDCAQQQQRRRAARSEPPKEAESPSCRQQPQGGPCLDALPRARKASDAGGSASPAGVVAGDTGGFGPVPPAEPSPPQTRSARSVPAPPVGERQQPEPSKAQGYHRARSRGPVAPLDGEDGPALPPPTGAGEARTAGEPMSPSAPKGPRPRSAHRPQSGQALAKITEAQAVQARAADIQKYGSNNSLTRESMNSTGSDEALEYRSHIMFLNALSSQTASLGEYVGAVTHEVQHILLADRCSVFFVDDVREEVWCIATSDSDSFSMPWDQGFIGLAAREGATSHVDTIADIDFDPSIEARVGMAVKSVLCIPIRHMLDQSRTIGVLEVINKLGGPAACFNERDVKVLNDISRLISDSFYRHRWKALESCSSRGDSEALSLLSHTSQQAHAKTAAAERTDAVNEKVQFVEVPQDSRVAGVAQLRSLNFNALDYSPEELVLYVEPIMVHTGCVERCGVPLDRLRSWAQAARKLYRDNPFHNWYHGFSVFQMCYYELFSSGLSGTFSSLEALGLLAAALCHDLDHPGFTNAFMVDCQSQLALRHNDIAVLENHHANLACELLRRDATAIGCGMDAAGQKALRRIVIKSILDTDMAHHGEMCKKLQAASSGTEDKQLMMGACIHSADLSAQVLPWRMASQWEERISMEFVNQAHEEVQAGRTPMPFMNFKMEDVKQRGKLQRDFLDFVLLPLWDPFTQLVPELRPCYRNLLKNRAFYQHRWAHGQDPSPEQTKSRRVAF